MSPHPKTRLLLVDDDHGTIAALAGMVADAGYEAVTASTWSEALRLFREEKPDLVLLDVLMPTVDGYKLAKMMKGEAPRFVPVILLTALEDLESKRRGMAAGADDFLSKPVQPLELSIRISSMLRIKDLTDQLQEANAKLAQLAVTDALTGLHNRRSLYAQLDREFLRAQRYARPLAVMMLDVDHFKEINDGHGHQVGDRVLRRLADVLRSTIRASDLAGRFGGEEFLVLAPETPRDRARTIAERVRAAIAATSADLPPVTVSIGAATTEHTRATSFEELVHLADDALYRAKEGGRNRVVVAD